MPEDARGASHIDDEDFNFDSDNQMVTFSDFSSFAAYSLEWRLY